MAAVSTPRDVLVTPDAVVLDLEPVGVASRGLALMIDVAAIGFAWMLSFNAVALIASTGAESLALTIAFVLLAATPIVYPMVLEATWDGRTLGKAVLGLRVVTRLGGRIGWRHAALRSIIGLFELYTTMGLVAFATSLATARGQRLGDLAAGTIVIRARSSHETAMPLAIRSDPRLEALVAGVTVGGLNRDEYALVRTLVERFPQLDADRRRDLATRVANRFATRLGAPPPATAPEDWLVAVVAAHQRARVRAAPPPVPPRGAPRRIATPPAAPPG